MVVFVSGGCKNGKSSHAERMAIKLKGEAPLYYIATMIAVDEEDDARIIRHRKSREHDGFVTLELGRKVQTLLEVADSNGTFLLDSLTALLANEMFGEPPCDDPVASIKEGLGMLFSQLGHLVIVSDYIYSDAAFYDDGTVRYMKGLAELDSFCACHADVVLEVCTGQVIAHKGEALYREVFGDEGIY